MLYVTITLYTTKIALLTSILYGAIKTGRKVERRLK